MEEKKKAFKSKFKIFSLLSILIFAVLLGQLYLLQIVQAEAYKTRSDGNRIRMLSIPAKRGDIITRDGTVLASSKPIFTISVSHLNNKEQEEQVAERLASLLARPEITKELIMEKLGNHLRRYEPLEIFRLPWSEESVTLITVLEERRGELPGLVIRSEPMRYYPEGALAGHILGFEGIISKSELEANKEKGYDLNDRIGKMGLEKSFELLEDEQGLIMGLRGLEGSQPIEVNASHRIVRELPVTLAPTPGNILRLTLDYKLQKVMEDSIREVIEKIQATESPKSQVGAGVLLDVKTGGILAMASHPEMNPNDFVDGSYGQKSDYYNDPKLAPTYNRAIKATYPPGSTFKPITAMAALESGKMNVNNVSVKCTGSYWKPPYIKCWSTHGVVDFYQAMAVSCNVFFQYAGELAGIEGIDKIADAFGLGKPTGLTDLPGESKGILPTPAWKKEINSILIERRYSARREGLQEKYDHLLESTVDQEEKNKLLKELDLELKSLEARYRVDMSFDTNWQAYDTYNTSIGQGSNMYTILQLANFVATLANGGQRFKPYLVDSIYSDKGELLKQFEPEIVTEVPFSQETLANTRKGMVGTTQPGGTAWALFRQFPPEIKVGAKTGTAETGLVGDDKLKDYHGIFIAFAPYDDPQIAFAGIIEYGKTGSGSAGLVAKAVFEEYFGLNEDMEEYELPEEFYVDFPPGT